jgi:hypothetical protein
MPLSKSQLITVHQAIRDIKLADEDYRAMLRAEFGVETSKNLDNHGFEALMKRFGQMGYVKPGKQVAAPTGPGAATNQQQFMIAELLHTLHLDAGSDYARGIFRKAGAAERPAWFTRAQASKVIDALQYLVKHGKNDVVPSVTGAGRATL